MRIELPKIFWQMLIGLYLDWLPTTWILRLFNGWRLVEVMMTIVLISSDRRVLNVTSGQLNFIGTCFIDLRHFTKLIQRQEESEQSRLLLITRSRSKTGKFNDDLRSKGSMAPSTVPGLNLRLDNLRWNSKNEDNAAMRFYFTLTCFGKLFWISMMWV